MKKIIFYISFISMLILFVKIIQILTEDFEQLTEYGIGYLIGKIVLFALFSIVVLLTKKPIIKN